jgi:hypothetical protein
MRLESDLNKKFFMNSCNILFDIQYVIIHFFDIELI